MIKKVLMASTSVVLVTTGAMAADLPSRRAPPVFVAPVGLPYSWTGLDFGLTTSVAFPRGQSVVSTPFGGAAATVSPISLNKGGLNDIGGQFGGNYQFTGTGIVIGAMAEVDYFNLHAYEDIFVGPGTKVNFQERLSYLGTANGRLGYAFDRVLVYATGGLAFGDVHTAATIPGYFGTASTLRAGYDVGGGVEYAIPSNSFLNNLSVERLLGLDKKLGINLGDGTIHAEYIHYDLRTQTATINATPTGGPGGYNSRFRVEGDLIRVGLGYKIGSTAATPVVARY